MSPAPQPPKIPQNFADRQDTSTKTIIITNRDQPADSSPKQQVVMRMESAEQSSPFVSSSSVRQEDLHGLQPVQSSSPLDSHVSGPITDGHRAGNAKICALILARGSSKSIRGKNVKDFNGVPLVCHMLKIVGRCRFFSSTWISTDAQVVKDIVNDYFPDSSVNIHFRSPKTSTDTATSISAVQEFISYHPGFDGIALIQCTSPCLSPKHLEMAFEKMIRGSESAFSAYRDTSLRWKSDGKKLIPANFDPLNRPRRQDIHGTFVESGHFYFATVDLIKRGLFQSSIRGDVIEMPPELCIELDEPYQWPLAELQYRIMPEF